MIRQERDGITTEWIAQGNVKSVPASSNNINVYADPTGREDEKRKALATVADALEKVLQRQQPLKEHPNRGLRALIIIELGDDEKKNSLSVNQV